MNLDPAIFGDRPKNLCRIEGCTRPRRRTGALCATHNWRKRNGKPLDAPIRPWHRHDKKTDTRPPCTVAGCWRPVKVHKHGLCRRHYDRKLRGLVVEGPINEHRAPETVVDLGVRVHRNAAKALDEMAKGRNIKRATLARQLLEGWAKQFMGEG